MDEPESIRVIKMLVSFRDAQNARANYQAVERAIDAIYQHSEAEEYRMYLMDVMAAHDAEMLVDFGLKEETQHD